MAHSTNRIGAALSRIATLAFGRWDQSAARRRRPPQTPQARALQGYAAQLGAAATEDDVRAARAALEALEAEWREAVGARKQRVAEALRRAADGKFAMAESVFDDLAYADFSGGQQDRKRAAAAWRYKGTLARLRSVEAALADYARAAELDPLDTETRYWLRTLSVPRSRPH
jgi:hypothetical protein